jgi:hypothetical protein
MRREKRRLESEEKYFKLRERLHEKRRKNSISSQWAESPGATKSPPPTPVMRAAREPVGRSNIMKVWNSRPAGISEGVMESVPIERRKEISHV